MAADEHEMSEQEPSPKIGTGHASAMARQGLAELRAALYPESNVAQSPQYGLYGTLTPGEVARAREASALESRLGEEHGEEPGKANEPEEGKDSGIHERG